MKRVKNAVLAIVVLAIPALFQSMAPAQTLTAPQLFKYTFSNDQEPGDSTRFELTAGWGNLHGSTDFIFEWLPSKRRFWRDTSFAIGYGGLGTHVPEFAELPDGSWKQTGQHWVMHARDGITTWMRHRLYQNDSFSLGFAIPVYFFTYGEKGLTGGPVLIQSFKINTLHRLELNQGLRWASKHSELNLPSQIQFGASYIGKFGESGWQNMTVLFTSFRYVNKTVNEKPEKSLRAGLGYYPNKRWLVYGFAEQVFVATPYKDNRFGGGVAANLARD